MHRKVARDRSPSRGKTGLRAGGSPLSVAKARSHDCGQHARGAHQCPLLSWSGFKSCRRSPARPSDRGSDRVLDETSQAFCRKHTSYSLDDGSSCRRRGCHQQATSCAGLHGILGKLSTPKETPGRSGVSSVKFLSRGEAATSDYSSLEGGWIQRQDNLLWNHPQAVWHACGDKQWLGSL